MKQEVHGSGVIRSTVESTLLLKAFIHTVHATSWWNKPKGTAEGQIYVKIPKISGFCLKLMTFFALIYIKM